MNRQICRQHRRLSEFCSLQFLFCTLPLLIAQVLPEDEVGQFLPIENLDHRAVSLTPSVTDYVIPLR